MSRYVYRATIEIPEHLAADEGYADAVFNEQAAYLVRKQGKYRQYPAFVRLLNIFEESGNVVRIYYESTEAAKSTTDLGFKKPAKVADTDKVRSIQKQVAKGNKTGTKKAGEAA